MHDIPFNFPFLGNWFVWIISILLYFLPSFIAASRKHNNFTPIFIINFFTGFTLIGWFVALVWSFTDNVKKDNKAQNKDE